MAAKRHRGPSTEARTSQAHNTPEPEISCKPRLPAKPRKSHHDSEDRGTAKSPQAIISGSGNQPLIAALPELFGKEISKAGKKLPASAGAGQSAIESDIEDQIWPGRISRSE